MRQFPIALSLLAVGLFCTIPVPTRGAEPAPSAKPDESTVGEVRNQTFKGFIYFHASTKATFQNIGDKAKTLIPAIEKAMADAHTHPAGPLIFIYHGASDANVEFELQIGFPISEKVTAPAEFKVRDVADYACTSVVYSGPLSRIGTAYEKLMPAAQASAQKPSDESREMYLYFEGLESANNVVHISVGKK